MARREHDAESSATLPLKDPQQYRTPLLGRRQPGVWTLLRRTVPEGIESL